MSATSVEHHLLRGTAAVPNNDTLALIVYRGAVDVGGAEPEAALEAHFGKNRWGDGFRGDTFHFHHYHSTAHEVVGCARGRAEVQFGGPDGPVVPFEAGDVVLIPAGVSHCRVDDAPGYSSVGAYPPGQAPDLCVLSEEDARVATTTPGAEGLALKPIGPDAVAATKAAAAAVPLPPTDPIAGESGPVHTLWLGR